MGDFRPLIGGPGQPMGDGPPKFADILANPLLLEGMQRSMPNTPEIQQLKNQFPAEIHKNGQEMQNSSLAVELEPSAVVESKMKLELQNYIDRKFTQLEATLMARIELAEKNTTSKLDLILEKLEKI